MEALFGRLSNLAYEFFGIVLPGAATLLAMASVWIVAGPAVPQLTAGVIPALSFGDLYALAASAMRDSAILLALMILAAAYFFGHLVAWISRRDKGHEEITWAMQVRGAMLFCPPRPKLSYSEAMEPMQRWIAIKLLPEDMPPTWKLLYPVAKAYVLQKATPTLTSVYQSKYTLHRSLAVIAAVTAWACGALLAIYLASRFLALGATPEWMGPSVLFALALLATWGFSSSYRYNWTLWGDYLIAETYAQLRAEKHK